MIIPAIEIVICLVIVWAVTQLRFAKDGQIVIWSTLLYFVTVGSAGAWLALDALQRLGVIAP